MKYLIAGSHPPFAHAPSIDALERRKALLAEGHSVRVVAPREEAAAEHVNLSGWMGALRLALKARRFDATIISLDSAMFFSAKTNRWARLADGYVLATLFRLAKVKELRIPDPRLLPTPIGARTFAPIWQAVERLVLANVTERAHAVHAGCPAEKILLIDVDRSADEPDAGIESFAEVDGEAVKNYTELSKATPADVQHQIRLRAHRRGAASQE